MRKLDLFLDIPGGQLVQGFTAANPVTSLRVTQNETLDIRIHNAVRNTAIPALTPFVARPLEFTSIRASIGNIDQAPRSGSFKLKIGDQTTTAITWTAPATSSAVTAFKATVLAALHALSNVEPAELIAVDPADSPAHILYFQWTNTRTDEIEVVEPKLIPWIDPKVTPGQTAAGYTQCVKLAQAPFVMATQFEREDAPLPTIIETRPGDTGTNAEQTLIIPAAAIGSLSLTWDGATTKTMAAGTVTAASLASALNAIVANGATAPQFRVEERPDRDGKRFAIEFIGALAGSEQAMLTVAAHDQEALLYAQGLMRLGGDEGESNLGIEQALNGAASVTLKFELVVNSANGPAKFIVPIEVVNDMTSASTVAALEASGAVLTVTREVSVDAGLGTPFAQASPGHSVAALPLTSATNVFNITHNLGTKKIKVAGWYKETLSPETWAQIPDDQFKAESVSDSVTKITLPFDVDVTTDTAATYATRYSFVFGSSDSEILLFEHGHPWTEIRESLPSGQTLAAKLAALDAAIAGIGGGAVIQGASLADGTVAPSKLDLTALATALFGNAKFVELLRAFGADETFIRNFLSRLNTSSTLADVRIALFTALLTEAKESTELQTLLLEVLKESEGFQEFLYEQVVAALAGGAQPPGHAFTMPDVNFYTPAPTTYTLGLETFTEFRGLPICYQSTTDGGNVSGTLAATGTAGALLTTTADTFALENDARPAQKFPTGAKLIWNGNFYQRVTQIGTAWYPYEMELPVIDAFLSESTFPANSIATINATLQTALDSPPENRIRARWRLALEIGVPTAESGELNLNAFTWSSAGTHTLNIGPEHATTGLQLQITRAATGTLALVFKVNGRNIATTDPSVGVQAVAIRARLTQFDTQNNTTPRGAVLAKVIRPGGLVVATT